MIGLKPRSNGRAPVAESGRGRDLAPGRCRFQLEIDALRSLLDALCATDLMLEEGKSLRAQLASLLARGS